MKGVPWFDYALMRAYNSINYRWPSIAKPVGGAVFGYGKQLCPTCNRSVVLFLPHGKPLRRGVLCPFCHSHERHRADTLFLLRRTNIASSVRKRVFHVAPEACMETFFRGIESLDLLSGDLCDPHAMVRADLCQLPFDHGSFDCIYCSHVLEHIKNDAAALAELFRVLAPGGWALLQVPVLGPKTIENLPCNTPEEREKSFGQHDHVRVCGEDYAHRMAAAGFQVQSYGVGDYAKPDEIERYGLTSMTTFLATKQKTSLPQQS